VAQQSIERCQPIHAERYRYQTIHHRRRNQWSGL
jgi:hypothetical protein